MVDLTTEIPGGGGGGNAGSSFSDAYFNVYNETDPTKLIGFDASNNAVGGQATLILPAGVTTQTYTAVLANYGNIFAGFQQEFDETGGGAAPILIRSDSMGVGGDFLRVSDETNAKLLSYLGPTAGLSADRSHSILDANGTYPLVGDNADPPSAGFLGRVNRTAQTADIASVKLTDTVAAGQYLIIGELECTTGAVGAGTVTVTFSWTNDSGAKTSAVTQGLTVAGSAAILIPPYLASGDITWAVTHTGIYSTAVYALRVRIVSLG